MVINPTNMELFQTSCKIYDSIKSMEKLLLLLVGKPKKFWDVYFDYKKLIDRYTEITDKTYNTPDDIKSAVQSMPE